MFSTYKRYVALFLLCSYVLCSFANFNSPASLQKSILQNYKLNADQYTLLFSMITWSSLLDMVHGYIIDRYLGLRCATIVYISIMITGGTLYSIASFVGEYWLLLLSRFIFGVGCNPLILCTNGYILQWFGNEGELNLAYSLQECMVWMGTSLLYFSSERIYVAAESKYSPFISLAVTITSETLFLLIVMTVTMGTLAFMTPVKKKDDTKSLIDDKITGENKGEEKVTTEIQQVDSQQKKLTFIDYISFPPIFWLYSFTCFLLFFGVLSFISLSQVFFMTEYGVDVNTASELSGLLTLIICLLGPLVGKLLDKIGQNLTCLVLCQILLVLSLTMFAYGNKYSPVIPVVLMSLGLAASSSSWSIFPNMVQEYQVLIAYGIAQTGLCAAMSVGTVISGYITNKYGYHGLAVFLLIIIISSIPFMIVVWILNYTGSNPLNKNKLKKENSDQIKTNNT